MNFYQTLIESSEARAAAFERRRRWLKQMAVVKFCLNYRRLQPREICFCDIDFY